MDGVWRRIAVARLWLHREKFCKQSDLFTLNRNNFHNGLEPRVSCAAFTTGIRTAHTHSTVKEEVYSLFLVFHIGNGGFQFAK